MLARAYLALDFDLVAKIPELSLRIRYCSFYSRHTFLKLFAHIVKPCLVST